MSSASNFSEEKWKWLYLYCWNKIILSSNSSLCRFGRMENDIEVVTELTHSSCRVVGLGLCKPVLFPSFFVLELMLMSLWNKFLNCSCCFSHYIEISLLEHFTWFFYIICLNEIQPLSDGESCHECVFVWGCLSVSFCFNCFYFNYDPWTDIWKREWPLSRLSILSEGLPEAILQELLLFGRIFIFNI